MLYMCHVIKQDINPLGIKCHLQCLFRCIPWHQVGLKELKYVEGRVEELVCEWEEDDVEGWEEGREKETLSLLVAPLVVLLVVCINTNSATGNATKETKFVQQTPCHGWSVCCDLNTSSWQTDLRQHVFYLMC